MSNTAAHLPPPPPAPILEQKQKKVGLSEYKERHRQNADVHERPIDPQTNEMQKRKSFIPDFSNASNLEMNEITLPAGIPISTSMFLLLQAVALFLIQWTFGPRSWSMLKIRLIHDVNQMSTGQKKCCYYYTSIVC